MGDALGWIESLLRGHGLTICASYLELALRLGLPLATDDRELQAAARAVHVDLL